MDLTPYTVEGYRAPEGAGNPHIWSSPAGIAWTIGKWARETGRSEPHSVKQSRGYSYRVEFMRNAPVLVYWHSEAGGAAGIDFVRRAAK
jgi:hypothetical protein